FRACPTAAYSREPFADRTRCMVDAIFRERGPDLPQVRTYVCERLARENGCVGPDAVKTDQRTYKRMTEPTKWAEAYSPVREQHRKQIEQRCLSPYNGQ